MLRYCMSVWHVPGSKPSGSISTLHKDARIFEHPKLETTHMCQLGVWPADLACLPCTVKQVVPCDEAINITSIGTRAAGFIGDCK